MAPTPKRYRITARGRVQGVGFRPTFYREMIRRGLAGSIRNTPQGVVLEVEGAPQAVQAVARDFRRMAPQRARVDELNVEELEPTGESGFSIVRSSEAGRSLLPIPPDLATCSQCRCELYSRADRRAGYPFNTCTTCGPRFSIARAVPFDRETNTMAEFPPCEECAREYASPADRRLHAQTISCPACGPSLSFLSPRGRELDGPLQRARRMLRDGKVLAVKGVGGFHLACDATREDVINRLRRAKARPAKPFAIMVAGVEAAREVCCVSGSEEAMLRSPASPIVLLTRRACCPAARAVAPGLSELGVMLAYTPLHMMLFAPPGAEPDTSFPLALVMTSCNRADEPIALTPQHVLEQMGDIVDGVLTHNRRIANRCDDSVVAPFRGRPLLVRRSRGYVPEPVLIAHEPPPLLATGGMNKVVFALSSGRRVFLSQHIGDVSDADSAAFFAEALREFGRLLRLEPQVVVCDLHPDYPTTAFARELAAKRALPLMQVQHHYAHIAGVMAEHGEPGPVIGVSWDGSGYGEDGAVWGGEFLLCTATGYERRCHLGYVPLPGGEQAIRHPARVALSHLARWLGPDEALRRMSPIMGDEQAELALRVRERERFSPRTSSAGRLFDAVSALLGVCREATYEGQPAIELEAACVPGRADVYQFGYDEGEVLLQGVFRGVCEDIDAGRAVGAISARFHATMARIIVETCRRLRRQTQIDAVACAGGVMQNRTLLRMAVDGLEADGFRVLLPRDVPPNDAGTSFGQAAWAAAVLCTQGGS